LLRCMSPEVAHLRSHRHRPPRPLTGAILSGGSRFVNPDSAHRVREAAHLGSRRGAGGAAAASRFPGRRLGPRRPGLGRPAVDAGERPFASAHDVAAGYLLGGPRVRGMGRLNSAGTVAPRKAPHRAHSSMRLSMLSGLKPLTRLHNARSYMTS